MVTAVDTSVLLDVLLNDPQPRSQHCIERRRKARSSSAKPPSLKSSLSSALLISHSS